MKLVVNVDGGARGNPGPAGIGAVVSNADGDVLQEIAERIGVATNNVAEYRALLRGIEAALALGADELAIIGDSELVARQLTGAYRVKHAALKPLHAEVLRALNGVRWTIRTVPRAQNSRADALVNAALDGAI
ncbi:MAG TPA: ribonuclease HI family protein [Solirubrobacteraceae bacterium]|nr:ribonuclease HI family protein [Solirubrobacteraceae bacterium]